MFWKKLSRNNDGKLIIVVGATRSGKTTYVKTKLLKGHKNIVVITIAPVWEYKEIYTISEWKQYRGGKVRITTMLFSPDFTPEILLWKRGYTLVIDDAPAIISQRSNLAWDKILLTYRNHAINVIYISQTFRKIPRHILSIADFFVIGYLGNKVDEERYLSDIYGMRISLPDCEPFSFRILKARK